MEQRFRPDRGRAGALVLVEVAGPEEEQADLVARDGVELMWVHRGDGAPGEALVAAVRSAVLPAGRGHLFVHGEAGAVRELRGGTEDRWQATKRAWNAAIEAEAVAG